MGAEGQSRLRVRVVAPLPAEGEHVHAAGRADPAAERVVGVRRGYAPATVEALRRVPREVERVERAAGTRVPGEQARRPERVGRRHRAGAIEFAYRLVAVIQEVRLAAAALLPRPQALARVARRQGGAEGGGPVLRVEGAGAAAVGRGVAVPVIRVGRVLVVGVE